MKNNRIKAITSILLVSLISMTSCSAEEFFNGRTEADNAEAAQYGHELDPEMHELIADSMYKIAGGNEEVRFETLISDEEIRSGDIPGLYDSSDNKVSEFYDDGTNGDRIAGDGIYTCSYNIGSADSESVVSYSAKNSSSESEAVDIYRVPELKEEDFDRVSEISRTFNNVVSDFRDENGYIIPSKAGDAIDSAENFAKELVESGEAITYTASKEYNNVEINLSNGITYVYQNKLEGMEAGDSKNINVKTFQPYNNSGDHGLSTSAPDDAANVLAGAFDTVSFTQNLDNQSVTTDTVKAFGADEIVIWNGHGGFTDNLHSFVVTGEETYASAFSSEDYTEGRIVLCGSDNDEKPYLIAYTYKFIDTYINNLNGSLVYLGCCEGAHDSVLASSFLNKSCSVVIGFSDSVLADYDRNIIKGFFNNLAKKKKFLLFFDKGYRTANEALNDAKSKYGKSSKYKDDDGFTHIAMPVLFGNPMYRLSDAVNDDIQIPDDLAVQAPGAFLLDKMYVSVKKGETTGIAVLQYPYGYEASDFDWTIEGGSIASCIDGVITGVNSGTTKLTVASHDNKYKVEVTVHVN